MSALARVVLLTPPVSGTATAISSSRIDLSWSSVVSAVSYRVYRGGVLVDSPAGTTSSSTGLSASTLYSFQVSSVDAAGLEGPKGTAFTAQTLSVPDTTAPTAPVISAAATSSSAITVSLTTASTDSGGSGLASYTLERATNSTFTANLVTEATGLSIFPRSVTGLSASTTYYFRSRATDGASNVGANSATASATTQASGTSFDQDFINRRSAAGVTAYKAFDSQADIDSGKDVGDNGLRVFLDTTVKVLSGGSMRFDLRANEGGANLSGNCVVPFGHTFAQNSDMYIQYRCRLSASMFSNNATYWRRNGGQLCDHKITIIYDAGGSTCDDIEITTIGPGNLGENIYTHCSNHSARSEATTPKQRDSTPFAWQMGWDLSSGPSWTDEANSYAHREFPSGPDAFPADEWFTIYEKVHIGTWGGSNSSIEMWIQRAGENFWRKKVSVNQYPLTNSLNRAGFNQVMFTPYMTQLQTTAPVNAYMWFSEFIVSTQPIARPLPA